MLLFLYKLPEIDRDDILEELEDHNGHAFLTKTARGSYQLLLGNRRR